MAARSGATMCARQDGSCAFSTPTRPRARRANGLFAGAVPAGRPVCRGDPTGAQCGPDDRLGRLPRTSHRRPLRSERRQVGLRPGDRHADNGWLAGERDGHAERPPRDRLRRFLHLRRRQSGTRRPFFRRALAKRQSSRPRSRPRPSLADKDTRAQWTDRWCHRSVYSWQIRTALAAALSDPRQSFTILPYGCSGATIPEGILYGYNGVEWSQASDKGIVGSRSEVGLAYQEICQPQAFRSYCVSGAPWCGRTEPPTVGQEQAPGFYDAAGPGFAMPSCAAGRTTFSSAQPTRS